MNNKYSPSYNTFFMFEFMERYEQAGTLPKDAQDVSYEVYAEFSQVPPEGYILRADASGNPSWQLIPSPTHEEVAEAADSQKYALIDQANEYINNKQWPGKAAIGRLKGEELERYNIWLDYLDALSSLDISHGDISWPEKPEAR